LFGACFAVYVRLIGFAFSVCRSFYLPLLQSVTNIIVSILLLSLPLSIYLFSLSLLLCPHSYKIREEEFGVGSRLDDATLDLAGDDEEGMLQQKHLVLID